MLTVTNWSVPKVKVRVVANTSALQPMRSPLFSYSVMYCVNLISWKTTRALKTDAGHMIMCRGHLITFSDFRDMCVTIYVMPLLGQEKK